MGGLCRKFGELFGRLVCFHLESTARLTHFMKIFWKTGFLMICPVARVFRHTHHLCFQCPHSWTCFLSCNGRGERSGARVLAVVSLSRIERHSRTTVSVCQCSLFLSQIPLLSCPGKRFCSPSDPSSLDIFESARLMKIGPTDSSCSLLAFLHSFKTRSTAQLVSCQSGESRDR